MKSLGLLLLKLSCLLGFCGGPLYVADTFKASLGKDASFAIAFMPFLLVIFGVYSLPLYCRSRWDKAMIIAGVVGIFIVSTMNIFAAFQLLLGAVYANTGLVSFGIVVGTSASAAYVFLAWRRLRAWPTAVQPGIQADAASPRRLT